jgi:hypothetical protein
VGALIAIRENKDKVTALSRQNSIDFGRYISPEEVVRGLNNTIRTHSTEAQSQREYADMIENMMAFRDERLLNGQWDILYTEPENPFVIGDAPVVTWNRATEFGLAYGVGFATQDVEVLLPVAPTACLHIKPDVQRTRRVKIPTTQEVNEAQAAFATKHCFTNLRSEALDAILQPKFGQLRMGDNGFRIMGINYEEKMFEILMNIGRQVA